MKYVYFIFIFLNIFSFICADELNLVYKNFDPKDENEYVQVLELIERNRKFLLSPHEDSKEVMKEYSEAVSGKQSRFYDGLQIKLLMTSDGKKVVGFVSYQPQKESDLMPYIVRMIIIDSEYRNLKLGSLLLFNVEQEAEKLNKKHVCLAVYLRNNIMLQLLQKNGYKRVSMCFSNDVDQNIEFGTCWTCKELKKDLHT